uniref:Ig-like domain-containing protein n=1 Tax=Denticeps clupeoides TaxID=299321 RepID=A0AAY4BCT0_9TELE
MTSARMVTLYDIECLEGDTVTFRCRICPSDCSTVKWYLDETQLFTNDLNEIQMSYRGDHTLMIRRLARKDSGTITFEAGDKRSYASLLVRAVPAEFTQNLNDVEGKEGQSVTLACEFSLPGVQYQWRKDVQTLRCGEKYQMKQKKFSIALVITDLRLEDSGAYTCICRDQSTTASVRINGKGNTTLSFHNRNWRSTKRIECSSLARPQALIWEGGSCQIPHVIRVNLPPSPSEENSGMWKLRRGRV